MPFHEGEKEKIFVFWLYAFTFARSQLTCKLVNIWLAKGILFNLFRKCNLIFTLFSDMLSFGGVTLELDLPILKFLLVNFTFLKKG